MAWLLWKESLVEVSVEQLPAREDTSGYAEVHGKVSSSAPVLHTQQLWFQETVEAGECCCKLGTLESSIACIIGPLTISAYWTHGYFLYRCFATSTEALLKQHGGCRKCACVLSNCTGQSSFVQGAAFDP